MTVVKTSNRASLSAQLYVVEHQLPGQHVYLTSKFLKGQQVGSRVHPMCELALTGQGSIHNPRSLLLDWSSERQHVNSTPR